jgi:hypothetical protein
VGKLLVIASLFGCFCGQTACFVGKHICSYIFLRTCMFFVRKPTSKERERCGKLRSHNDRLVLLGGGINTANKYQHTKTSV